MLKRFILFLLAGGLVLGETNKKAKGKIDWLYASLSFHFEHWVEVDDPSGPLTRFERIQDVGHLPENLDRPQSFYTLNLGGQYSFPNGISLLANIPFFLNAVESYNFFDTSATPQYTGGLGDPRFELGYKWRFLSLRWRLGFPGGYRINRSPFVPWAGFSVFRMGFTFALTSSRHYVAITPDFVLADPFKRAEEDWVLLGDVEIYSTYVYTQPVLKWFALKPSFAYSYSSYHWNGEDNDPELNHKIYLGIALSFTPTWQNEVSISISGTAYASKFQTIELNNTRAIIIGIYYGHYR